MGQYPPNIEYTHYELLELPSTASSDDILTAYRKLKNLYSCSDASYSLIDPDECGDILSKLDRAYHILRDPIRRQQYDVSLALENVTSTVSRSTAESGHQEQEDREKEGYRSSEMEFTDIAIPIDDDMNPIVPKKKANAGYEIPVELPKELADEIAFSDEIDGTLLRRIRESRRIPLDRLSHMTKIVKNTIDIIETNSFKELPAEVYLKGFLKNMAQALGIDPAKVVSGDFKNIERNKPAAGK